MNAHKPELDHLTPAEIRVICEQLLYTMDIEQRTKFKTTYPGLYEKVVPTDTGVLDPLTKRVVAEQDTGKGSEE